MLNSLGEYRIIKVLGKGGMGVVYLVEHQRLRKKYALKILPEMLAKDEQLVERFHNEARIMAELDHPNIVKVVNMSCQGSVYYLVMEYIESETGTPKTLQDFLRARGGILPEAEVERITLDVLSALDYAHSYSSKAAPRGIIHRDVKPANVLLDKKGTAKVTDFGLAKILAGEHPSSTLKESLTEDGAILGTYNFMSPEQREGKPADARSDIYSVGVLIYNMLTGRKPEGLFSLPSEVNPALSKKWDRIVEKCLQNLPESRFQSASEITKIIKENEAIKREKVVKEKKRTRLRELLGFRTALIGLAAVLAVFLAYSFFWNKDVFKTFKSYFPKGIREEPKKVEQKLLESPMQKEAAEVKAGKKTDEKTVKAKAAGDETKTIANEKAAEKKDETAKKVELAKKPEPFQATAGPKKASLDNFVNAMKMTASLVTRDGLKADRDKLEEYYRNASEEERLIFDFLIKPAADFMKADNNKLGQAMGELAGIMEIVKQEIPAGTPLEKNWDLVTNKLTEGKISSNSGEEAKARESLRQAQTQMRIIFASWKIKQDVELARVSMAEAKKRAEETLLTEKKNLLYQAALKVGQEAEVAREKNDLAKARIYYAFATDIFSMSRQDCQPDDCIRQLQKYVEKAKLEADNVKASYIARDLYSRATKAEQQAHTLFQSKRFKEAANYYIESAFFYERSKERGLLRGRIPKAK